jgi:hypothetical protein
MKKNEKKECNEINITKEGRKDRRRKLAWGRNTDRGGLCWS